MALTMHCNTSSAATETVPVGVMMTDPETGTPFMLEVGAMPVSSAESTTAAAAEELEAFHVVARRRLRREHKPSVEESHTSSLSTTIPAVKKIVPVAGDGEYAFDDCGSEDSGFVSDDHHSSSSCGSGSGSGSSSRRRRHASASVWSDRQQQRRLEDAEEDAARRADREAAAAAYAASIAFYQARRRRRGYYRSRKAAAAATAAATAAAGTAAIAATPTDGEEEKRLTHADKVHIRTLRNSRRDKWSPLSGSGCAKRQQLRFDIAETVALFGSHDADDDDDNNNNNNSDNNNDDNDNNSDKTKAHVNAAALNLVNKPRRNIMPSVCSLCKTAKPVKQYHCRLCFQCGWQVHNARSNYARRAETRRAARLARQAEVARIKAERQAELQRAKEERERKIAMEKLRETLFKEQIEFAKK